MNADLQQFVRDCLARGLARDAIREQLDRAGWRAEEIDAALTAWAESDFPVPVPRRRSYLSARETFLYLVLFVTLYVTAYNVGVLLFQFIERWLPDPALQRATYDVQLFNARAVRDAIAALVIAFPVYALLSRYIGRQVEREPEKRGSKVRKWLTYVTLFLAALVILGDLTFVVARALSGELAPRFLARAATVLVIAAFVFGHYLGGLRQEEDERRDRPAAKRSPIARLAGAGVVAVVAIAMWLAGTPSEARHDEIDQRRVRDLQQIEQAIQAYYREHRALPPSLEALVDQPNVFVESIQDPVTRRAYGFRATGATTYMLCSDFTGSDLEPVKDPNRIEPTSQFWRHGPGAKCYALFIPRGIVDLPARP